MLKIDIAHTYAIAGFGKDELASTLIFLAVRCRKWGERNIPSQLEAAFESFDQWCKDKHKVTTIKSFAFEELKIKSLLIFRILTLKLFLIKAFFYRKLPLANPHYCLLRNH